MHFPHTTLRFLTHRVSFHPTLQSPHCMGHIIASFCPHFLASGELLRFLFMPSIETIQIDMNSQLCSGRFFQLSGQKRFVLKVPVHCSALGRVRSG